ncbi:MAG: type II toxin-antitoxin system RelE/ParE family toxin [Pseudomonadales bacterium]|nr:type II toxin-antitoxin system RelE/ParE family toxin [Halioglobus sp.]MCP5123682.1 type II toxin-antitoxin system RelE/ParE family toxin [Pseudomonadales bacterium]MCP5192003.1 type II toxin-antitoxin system RelE/ParE family toxin [Pseudomonadales bacterium]
MLTLVLTDQAEADIEEIYLYIALESYQTYAESFASKAFKTSELLCHSPHMGTERTRSGEGVRFYPMDKVNIFYRVVSDQLQILRVKHSALDSNKLRLQ